MTVCISIVDRFFFLGNDFKKKDFQVVCYVYVLMLLDISAYY